VDAGISNYGASMISRFIAILFMILSATTVAAQNSGDALEKLRATAEQGFAEAQFALGQHYYLSNLRVRGPREPDYTKAVEWYRKAAGQGHWNAQIGLAHLLSEGSGRVPADRVLAYTWYTLALPFCQSDDPKSIGDYFHCQFSATQSVSRMPIKEWRDVLAERMAPAEIAEAKRLAAEWAKRLPVTGGWSPYL